MNTRIYNKAVTQFNKLKKEIDFLGKGNVLPSMKIIIGAKESSLCEFDLRSLNKDIKNNKQ